MKPRAAKNTLAVDGTGPLQLSPVRWTWMIHQFFTSDLQDGITYNNELEGDASRTFRVFWFGFGLFERTETLFPGQVGKVTING